MKLWQKDSSTSTLETERFTVGRDREFDLALAPFDVQGSLAHTAMLAKVGLLAQDEYEMIRRELEKILEDIREGNFSIREDAEDIHSQIEMMLTEKLGDAGKKIHSGRSRNDQVAVDIKLFLRASVLDIRAFVFSLFNQLVALAEAHKDKLMPGYTHLQLAMPSSFGLWFSAYAESLADDMTLLVTAYHMANRNPLGSGAGYGSSLPLDRDYTTELLRFGSLHYSSIYAQMSRGKTERFVAVAISSVAATLARMSMDMCLYLNQNFGFVSFPDELTTGSSIMPHKKNPDVFELIRAKCNRIQSVPNELALLAGNLPSGYHRDMQLTKEILFPAIDELQHCIRMMQMMLDNITIKENILADDKYKYLFTVEKVNELVNAGIPFRDAYRQVGLQVAEGTFDFSGDIRHTHKGSIGNLCLPEICSLMEKAMNI